MENKEKKKKDSSQKFSISTQELIPVWSEVLKNENFVKEVGSFPTFDRGEMDMLSFLLFWKTQEFRVWFIRKKDKRAIKEFIAHREAQRQGVPRQMSTIHVRRLKFIKELMNSNFNGAEAARRCGYSWKYAKQVAYRIRRNSLY